MISKSPVDEVLLTLQTAETHISSEYVDDLEATLASVTQNPTYAFMPEPGQITVITDSEKVRDFYVGNRTRFLPIATRFLTHIGSDWYVFQENVPTRRILDSGKLVTLNTVNLFPRASDGIQGEFLWERYDLVDPAPKVSDEFGPSSNLPTRKLRNALQHERFIQALRDRALADIPGLLTDDCLWAVRNYLGDSTSNPITKAEGKIEVIAALKAWHDAFSVERISVLTRLATEWYVFADELYTVRTLSGSEFGEQLEFRIASIYPVASGGLIQGRLGWGTEATTSTSGLESQVGRLAWLQAGENEGLENAFGHGAQ